MTSPDPTDIAACRALLRTGSRTFHAASLALPRRVADPAIALYAFCRLADDAVDCNRDGDSGRVAAVARLSDRLDRACRGMPLPQPADRAFAGVMARFSIPRELPEALLEGLSWDAESRRYETLDDLSDYAARVAGSVGAMMSLVMGRRAPQTVARACELGIAMQFTNIARDVGEDARAGRLYLPLSWLRESNIDPDAFLADPRFTPEIAALVQRLLDAADALYARAMPGIAKLPASCRPGIRAARSLYAEIGRQVERNGGDSISTRAVVSGRRKIGVLAASLAKPSRRHEVFEPIIPAAQFLIDAVEAMPVHGPRPQPRRAVSDRVVWVFELFARLEQREQVLRRM